MLSYKSPNIFICWADSQILQDPGFILQVLHGGHVLGPVYQSDKRLWKTMGSHKLGSFSFSPFYLLIMVTWCATSNIQVTLPNNSSVLLIWIARSLKSKRSCQAQHNDLYSSSEFKDYLLVTHYEAVWECDNQCTIAQSANIHFNLVTIEKDIPTQSKFI